MKDKVKVVTIKVEVYQSRLQEMRVSDGVYTELDAARDYHHYLIGCTTDYVEELGYWDRRRIHNLKYYTWVEQQGKSYEEIMDQWYQPDYWSATHAQIPEIDRLIEEFNQKVGLL